MPLDAPSQSAHNIPSSSPAFGTPIHPIRTSKPQEASKPSILPISLPPATLRPLAFRVFTKKHNLNLTSSALQSLATVVGKQCGSTWREEGLAERILDEAAKQWKKRGGGVLVPGEGEDLVRILNDIGFVAEKKVHTTSGDIDHQRDILTGKARVPVDQRGLTHRTHSGGSKAPDERGAPNSEALDVQVTEATNDPRPWLAVVGAFEQPRLAYNPKQKHFENMNREASILSRPNSKTDMSRQRYHVIHQRLMRNESFQTSAVAAARQKISQRSTSASGLAGQTYKLTLIANLLGRGGSNHMLMGMLSRSPSGHLAINDLTGSIILDTQYARPSPKDGVWFVPGMLVVVDGQYEDVESNAGSSLDGNAGVGGTIGGIFLVFGMTGPPCERRDITLGLRSGGSLAGDSAGAGLGWVDFLGVGSERAIGDPMRELESRVLKESTSDLSNGGRARIILIGEVNLDRANTLQALKKVLAIYAADSADATPMAIVLMGNFVRYAAMAGGGSGGSIEYKEYFDSLASALSDYPSMLQNTTFIFVPGDRDPWGSAFSSGAATMLPKETVPELFTSRIRRAFATANAESERATGRKSNGEAIWTTNPARLTLFGPVHEIVLFRDDMSGRFRRHAIRFDRDGGNELDSIDNKADEDGQSENQGAELCYNGNNEDRPNGEAVPSHASKCNNEQASPANIPLNTQIARKLVKTILDQGYLSPFPTSQRPVMWDYAQSLHLYPLPTSLVIMDAEAPAFAVGLDGCHVMNPGCLIDASKKGLAQWMEYNVKTRRGKIRDAWY